MDRLQAPSKPRSPWQLLYAGAHSLRWQWYSRRAARLPRPVISVGNLHWGGAGKTPLVAAIATHLRDRGMAVAILSRGYRRRGKGVRLVSSGDGPLLGPLVAGDEPVLLAGDVPGVAVLVGRDRSEAGRHALERLDPPPELFLLDDGFSHLRLFRDIDLVAFPADDPFAGGRLLPGGRLREPLASMARADAAVLVGGSPEDARRLALGLEDFGFAGPAFGCTIRALPARLTHGAVLPAGSSVIVVAAIARADRFLSTVRASGLEVVQTRLHRDHYDYPARSLARIERLWRRSGTDAILTTSKDRVKLLGRLDAPLAELPIRAELEPRFWQWLDRRLEQQIAETAGSRAAPYSNRGGDLSSEDSHR